MWGCFLALPAPKLGKWETWSSRSEKLVTVSSEASYEHSSKWHLLLSLCPSASLVWVLPSEAVAMAAIGGGCRGGVGGVGEETRGPRLGDVPSSDSAPTRAALDTAPSGVGVGTRITHERLRGVAETAGAGDLTPRRTASIVLPLTWVLDKPLCSCPGRGAPKPCLCPRVKAASVPTAPGTQPAGHQGWEEHFPLSYLLTALHLSHVAVSLHRGPL